MKRYKTKKQRLVAIVEVFRKATNHKLGTAFDLNDVAEWAISKKLWPVPERGQSEKTYLDWEDRLQQAMVR